MKKEPESCNNKNQDAKKIVNIDSCETLKKVDLTVNMCSYSLNDIAHSISFCPCEINKEIDISTQVDYNSFPCSYIDSLIASSPYCIYDESSCHLGDNSTPDNNSNCRHNTSSDCNLAIIVLAALIDMLLKNCSNKDLNQDKHNGKHHKHHKHRKHDNCDLNNLIILIILGLLNQFKE